jgi:hypothetical protein
MWGVHVLIMSIILIYVSWCPTRLPYHMMFVSVNSNTTGATCGAWTANPCEAHELTPAFSGVRISRFSFICIKFCRSLFVLFLFGHCVVCPTIHSSDYPFGIFKLFYLDSFIEELEDTRRVIRLTRRVSLVEQELLTLPEHLCSPPFWGRLVLLDL